MKVILALAGAVALGVAPQAHADPNNFGCLPGPNDCAYISALQRDGIPTRDDMSGVGDVFVVGEHVCRLLARGKTVDDVAQALGIVVVIAADAHDYLCPDAGRVNA